MVIIARMTFYTTKGDDGTTGVLGEGRVPKYHARMEALGALDEASAALGLARAQTAADSSKAVIPAGAARPLQADGRGGGHARQRRTFPLD